MASPPQHRCHPKGRSAWQRCSWVLHPWEVAQTTAQHPAWGCSQAWRHQAHYWRHPAPAVSTCHHKLPSTLLHFTWDHCRGLQTRQLRVLAERASAAPTWGLRKRRTHVTHLLCARLHRRALRRTESSWSSRSHVELRAGRRRRSHLRLRHGHVHIDGTLIVLVRRGPAGDVIRLLAPRRAALRALGRAQRAAVTRSGPRRRH